MKLQLTTAAAIVASSLLLATPGRADIVEVAPCNHFAGDSEFLPGLRVTINGRSTYFEMGLNGLTRSIIYNPAQAKAWVEQALGLSGNPIVYMETCYPEVDDTAPAREPQEETLQEETPV